MIRTIKEAYTAMHGKAPDAQTTARLARIMAAAGVTHERDPLAGVIVLLDAYYGNMQATESAIRNMLSEMKATERRIHTHIESVRQPPSTWQRLKLWVQKQFNEGGEK